MKKLFTGKKWFTLSLCLVLAATGLYLGCKSSIFRGKDGSKWKLVSTPGFGNDNNSSVVAMAEYKNYLYAMTRNKDGAEVWRMNEDGQWEQVMFPNGQTRGFYGNEKINNIWGRMIVFQDNLYFGTASGFQGDKLNSTGGEIWRYDGTTWEAVISDKKDTEDNGTGTITAIYGCSADDGDQTAQIADSTKNWTKDQWKGGSLQITSGAGKLRKFYIIGNDAASLLIQQGEQAATGPEQPTPTEWTDCSEKTYTNAFPVYSYTLGAVESGDSYEIGMGTDESGFGDIWNKTITDMRIFDNKLYVSTGLNYARGSQVWYTADGDTWQVTKPPNSFGNFHNDATYPDSKKPVSSSLPALGVSSCSGEATLYATGTGTSGEKGSCARMAMLADNNTWDMIVDNAVDSNTTGTNENGLGDCPSAQAGNFMVWNMVEFKDKLFVVINSMLGGTRVMYTETGSSADDAWKYSVGGEPAKGGSTEYPNGFDDAKYPEPVGGLPAYQNIAGYLSVFNNTLYCGTLQMYWGPYADKNYPNGAHIWKSSDGLSWTKVTGDGFKDDQIIMFEAFATYKNKLYVSGSKSANTELIGLGGAKVYCQVKEGR